MTQNHYIVKKYINIVTLNQNHTTIVIKKANDIYTSIFPIKDIVLISHLYNKIDIK